jgi:hypothetical protein
MGPLFIAVDLDQAGVDAGVGAERPAGHPPAILQDDRHLLPGPARDVTGGEDEAILRDDDAAAGTAPHLHADGAGQHGCGHLSQPILETAEIVRGGRHRLAREQFLQAVVHGRKRDRGCRGLRRPGRGRSRRGSVRGPAIRHHPLKQEHAPAEPAESGTVTEQHRHGTPRREELLRDMYSPAGPVGLHGPENDRRPGAAGRRRGGGGHSLPPIRLGNAAVSARWNRRPGGGQSTLHL